MSFTLDIFSGFSWQYYQILYWNIVASFPNRSYRSSSDLGRKHYSLFFNLRSGLFSAIFSEIRPMVGNKNPMRVQIKFDFGHGWPIFCLQKLFTLSKIRFPDFSLRNFQIAGWTLVTSFLWGLTDQFWLWLPTNYRPSLKYVLRFPLLFFFLFQIL